MSAKVAYQRATREHAIQRLHSRRLCIESLQASVKQVPVVDFHCITKTYLDTARKNMAAYIDRLVCGGKR